MVFDHTVAWSYFGGFASLALTVLVIFLKDNYKRDTQRKVLEKLYHTSPEEIGNIDAKLDIDGFKSPNVFQIAAMWGVQPLFILCFLNIPTLGGEYWVIVVFILILITLLHEFYSADRFSGKLLYQLFILSLWISLFLFNNKIAKIKGQEKITSKSEVLK
ncbi:hypothetical protein MKQ70_16520 [Chitinophaga sedimenti]|uniref:hypothetical protein n=1 Tax=Chitinophaga sedimenti TaxID=2033606 RepID=UPI0020058205|nr:hypothetical protein [Chitinophaga sedimenti]MCK7556533.1 hypothetical protein [Chitinophaga sedimenti]